MSRCIPCEYKQAIEQQRVKALLVTAKKRAKEQNEFFILYFDTEDQKYLITTKAKADSEGYEAIETISPY